MPPTFTKASGEAQARAHCGAECATAYRCGKRRAAFERLGVCPHLSDDLLEPAFSMVLAMLESAHVAGYRAGQRDVLAQTSARWAA